MSNNTGCKDIVEFMNDFESVLNNQTSKLKIHPSVAYLYRAEAINFGRQVS